MIRRIKIQMVCVDVINKQYDEGYENYPSIYHTLLSNYHKYPDWAEISIDAAQREGKDTLMIGIDV